MPKMRHRSRQVALQILYATEYVSDEPSVVFWNLVDAGVLTPRHWTPFCRDLVEKTIANRSELDQTIAPVLEHWRLERLAKVDHLLLCLALCEIRLFPDIPLRVTINEYVELAKEYGGEESSAFVNGILDKLAHACVAKDFQQEQPRPASGREHAQSDSPRDESPESSEQ